MLVQTWGLPYYAQMGFRQKRTGQVAQLEQSVRSTVKDLGSEITLYGLAQPQTLRVNRRAYARMLDKRLQVERATAYRYRRESIDLGLRWSIVQGLYRSWADDYDHNFVNGEQPLVGLEAHIAENIDRLLEERTTGKPVVAMDFGGGLGLTWMRIASQPKYQAAVESNRLVMAVTNLGLIPDVSPDSDGYTGVARSMNYTNNLDELSDCRTSYAAEDLRWAQEAQRYVQHLDASSLELLDDSVGLSDGTHLPLRGNVDIIHEHLALAHTHVPDLALASFGELMSDRGTFYSQAASYYHLMHPEQYSHVALENGKSIHITGEYSYQRRLALAVGSIALRQQGFSFHQNEIFTIGVFSRMPSEGL